MSVERLPGGGAVFLSYAREDTAAALRLAEALRTGGVEVWFDQSELRGGDAWDAKIKKQIQTCALFLPIISVQTQARTEGYFRLEWRLAEQRTHLRGRSKAFLVPVCIDGTKEGEADVPEAFLGVQWTRLAGGETSAAFVERVCGLLGGVSRSRTRERLDGVTDATTGEPPARSATKRRSPRFAIGLGVVVIAVALWVVLRPAPPQAAAPSSPPASTAAPPRSEFASAKSVAVLPFENLSDEKGNDSFSDGITEELLDVLSRVPSLRVTARTSAFAFKGRNLTAQEIGQKLGVTHVVEGSVRKVGTQLRIRAQLISTADGFPIWSQTFPREWKDIFSLQDEIAGLIAQNLSLKLGMTAGAKRAVNPEAHQLLLEARNSWELRTEVGYARAESALARALEIDPTFAEAHARLATVCITRAHIRGVEGLGDFSDDLNRGRRAALRASELDPTLDLPPASLAYGLMVEGRFAESEKLFLRALALNPNSTYALANYAGVISSQGRLADAIALHKKCLDLDPVGFTNLLALTQIHIQAQRFDEALRFNDRATAVLPADIYIPNRGYQARILLALGRKAEAVEVARMIRQRFDVEPRWQSDSVAVWVLRQAGFESEAAEYAAELLKKLPRASYQRGFVLSALGRFEEALPFLERTPVTPGRWLYWDAIWDPWRDDPRFAHLMTKLGRAKEYKTAREELARITRPASRR